MDVMALRKALASPSVVERVRAVDGLAGLRTAQGIEGLYAALSDRSDFVVARVLEHLAVLAEEIEVSIKVLFDFLSLRKDEPHLRARALDVLARSGNPLVIKVLAENLRDPDRDVQLAATGGIVRYGRNAIVPLVNVLTEESAEYYARENAALALSFLAADPENDVATVVKNVLSVKSVNVRFAAARAFKEIGNPEFSQELKDFLKIDEVENSEELKKILKRVTKKDEMEQLVATLAKMDEKTCLDLIVALKKGKNVAESQERLARIFRSVEDKRVKSIIIRIVGLARAQAAIPLLQECLKDPDKRVRANAVEALSEIGGDYVIELLKPMINDYDNRVRANAAKGLWALGGVRSLQILKDMLTNKDKWMRASAAYALGEIGVIQTVDLLIQALNDPEVDVRVNVVKALARTGDLVALNHIMDVVRNKSEEWPVRKNAIIAIGRTRIRKGIEFLENLLADASESQLAKETIQIVLDEVRA